VVGVMGSGWDEHPSLTIPLGELIAKKGFDLLTGGGGGVMKSVSAAFTSVPDRQGICIGILKKDTQPNPFVELPIFTHLPHSSKAQSSRNHINVLTPAVVIALPGGAGTLSEIELAVAYGRPIVFFWRSYCWITTECTNNEERE